MTIDSIKLKNVINSMRGEVAGKYNGQKLTNVLEGLGLIDDWVDDTEKKHNITVQEFLETWE